MTSLLQRLSDNNPKQQDELIESADGYLEEEIMMLLSSRPRFSEVEHIPVLNGSILNYGINENFTSDMPIGERKSILQARLEMAIQRFEPRLKDVSFTTVNQGSTGILFFVNAYYQNRPVHYKLIWDDAINRFYLSE
ncbi:type VI secretion system lysozyme-like protein [Yersinia intermedia]|uniref:Type VI secretion system lysozyme-like protein n=1 Tax=Yersinia intermedia TaxID=631 RepID=A0A0H5LZ93_YERIN|nr:GPW/gp25 family protein [Yersinia intermedia]CRY56513.1 type VI secretion system lysozyme-like protein [Yersinia intermedia]